MFTLTWYIYIYTVYNLLSGMRGLFRGFVIKGETHDFRSKNQLNLLSTCFAVFDGELWGKEFLSTSQGWFWRISPSPNIMRLFCLKIMNMLVQRQVLLTPLGEVQNITLLNASIKNDWTTLWLGWEDTAPNETMMKRFWLQVCYQSCWWLVAVFLDREETKRKRQAENLPFALWFLSIEKNCNKPARYWPGTPWMLCTWIIQILQVQACHTASLTCFALLLPGLRWSYWNSKAWEHTPNIPKLWPQQRLWKDGA